MLLCPWDSLGKNTGVSCHFLLHVNRKFTCSLNPIPQFKIGTSNYLINIPKWVWNTHLRHNIFKTHLLWACPPNLLHSESSSPLSRAAVFFQCLSDSFLLFSISLSLLSFPFLSCLFLVLYPIHQQMLFSLLSKYTQNLTFSHKFIISFSSGSSHHQFLPALL